MTTTKVEKHSWWQAHGECTCNLKNMRKQKWNGRREKNEDIKKIERKIKNKETLPISDALDSNGAFFKFHEVEPFGKLQVSLVVKIYTQNAMSHNTNLQCMTKWAGCKPSFVKAQSMLIEHSFSKQAISASTPFSNQKKTNRKLGMTKNKNEKIKEKNDGLEYMCPKKGLVKSVVKDFLWAQIHVLICVLELGVITI